MVDKPCLKAKKWLNERRIHANLSSNKNKYYHKSQYRIFIPLLITTNIPHSFPLSF